MAGNWAVQKVEFCVTALEFLSYIGN